jgi:hypothetical protein
MNKQYIDYSVIVNFIYVDYLLLQRNKLNVRAD